MPRKRLTVKRHTVAQPSDPSYRLIPLTRGMNAMVDAEDFEHLSQWNWQACWNPRSKTFVAQRTTPTRKTVYMSRAVLGYNGPGEVDHKNRTTLDNRKQNLRACGASANKCNRANRADNKSGFKGVYFHRPMKKWHAEISVRGQRRHLGYFQSKEEAARAYDDVAKILHGPFAYLNFPTA